MHERSRGANGLLLTPAGDFAQEGVLRLLRRLGVIGGGWLGAGCGEGRG